MLSSLLRVSSAFGNRLLPRVGRVPNQFHRLYKTSSSRVDNQTRLITVNWSDGASDSVLPIAWLRDSCQCEKCFHPTALSRIQQMSSFDPEIKVDGIGLNDAAGSCRVTWSDGHVSDYNYDWLRRRSFDTEAQAARTRWYGGKQKLWTSGHSIDRHNYGQVLKSDEALLNFLNSLEVFGVAIVDCSPQPQEATASTLLALCNRVAYPMPSNYGVYFDVMWKPDPSNPSYTPGTLGLHNDSIFYKPPPNIQLLHCVSLSDSIVGGENHLTDGFYAANLLRLRSPDAFKVLTETLVDFCDHGTDFLKDFYLLGRQRLISLDRRDQIKRICYSNHGRDTYLNIPAENVQKFFDSLKAFDTVLNGDECRISYRLKEGEILVLDNYRVLHGREKYTALDSTAQRHLQGAYLRWDETRSRMRKLQASVLGRHF